LELFQYKLIASACCYFANTVAKKRNVMAF